MTWNNKVVWSEGMFLQPQHFQQHDRYLEKLLENRTAPLLGYSWGFSSLELNSSELKSGKIQLSAARGIFPDGTPFDFPYQDEPPIPLDIDADMRDETVVLALPMRRDGMDETDSGDIQDSSLVRYSTNTTDIKDSNAQINNKASLEVGRLRLKLMRQRDVTGAYTTLGVVQVTERRSDNQVVLQQEFIPPMLHVGAHTILSGYLQELCGLLHQCAEMLASLIAQPNHPYVLEVRDYLILQTINRNELLLAHLLTIPVLHPERLYSICLNLVGDFATFSSQYRPRTCPVYQHNALGVCFPKIMEYLRQLIVLPGERKAVSIKLQDCQRGYWLAIINDKDLLKSANFFLAACAQLDTEILRTRFPTQIKAGPKEKVQQLVDSALSGIPLKASPAVPEHVPYHIGFNYFQFERNNELWKQLEYSAGFGMHIAGDWPGLKLELWAVKDEKL